MLRVCAGVWLLSCTLSLSVRATSMNTTDEIKVGSRVPAFSLLDQNGNMFDISIFGNRHWSVSSRMPRRETSATVRSLTLVMFSIRNSVIESG